MPGTGLARNQNSVMRFLWKFFMPSVGLFLPDTSNPKRSSRTASWIMTEDNLPFKSGAIISFNKKPNKYVWNEVVFDEKIGKEVFEDSLSIIKNYL
jgi:hypothetical protein